jgi:hypothetical protein
MVKCDCQDWQKVSSEHKDLIQQDPEYGWFITWIEISKENNFHKTSRYGIAIQYCPFCGKKINET